MTFNLETIMVGEIILGAIAFLVMLQLWYRNRRHYPGLSLWAVSWGLQLVGTVSIAMRGTVADWESVVVANSALVGSILVLYFGLRIFMGKKPNRGLNYALLVLFAMFVINLAYFTYAENNLVVRSVNFEAGIALVSLICTFLIFTGSDPDIRRISKSAGVAFGAIAILNVIRIAGVTLSPPTSNNFLQIGLFDALLLLLCEGAVAFLAYSLVMMINGRLLIETRRMNQELTRRESELKAVFASTTVGLATLDNRIIKEVNDGCLKILGYSRDEMVGKHYRQFYPTEEDYRRFSELDSKISELWSGTTETHLLCRDGSIVNAIISSSAFDQDDLSKGLVVSMVDITRRKQAEEALQREKDQAQLYLDVANVMLLVLSTDGHLALINKKGCEILGYKEEEIVSKDWFELCVPTNMRNEVKSVFMNLTAGGSTSFEYYENPILTKGGEQRIIAFHNSILQDGSGSIIGLLSSGEDVTEQRKMEQEIKKSYQNEQTLRRSLESEIKKRIEFTRVLVHELKTPLTPILASSELMARELKGEPWLRLSKNIYNGAIDLNSKIDELLDLSRGELGMLKLNIQPVDIDKLLQNTLMDMVPMALSSEIKLKLNVDEPLPIIKADAVRLKQVLMNLISNSLKYSSKESEVTVTAKQEGNNLMIEVKDQGQGIRPEMQKRLFQPYQRLETNPENSSGLGLGLALSKKLIELHGGRIWVKSQVGEGSLFGFSLPISRSQNIKKVKTNETFKNTDN